MSPPAIGLPLRASAGVGGRELNLAAFRDFTLTTTVAERYDDAVSRVRGPLHDAGFGVLTEIDPVAMTSFNDVTELGAVAHEARERLTGMLAVLGRGAEGETSATGA